MDSMAVNLLQIIGSPYAGPVSSFDSSREYLDQLFDLAFENRVELLFLDALKKRNLLTGFEERYGQLQKRAALTLDVIARAGAILSSSGIPYAVFKSIKPYPATPNDTDIICMGNKEVYRKAYDIFLRNGYQEHGVAPLQINIYDPRGEGKIGPGKKGGTYYIDFYQDIATDYFVYINKTKLESFVREQEVNGSLVRVLSAEPELAIVMYHNVFPEKTFHLEHFYLPLYRYADPVFDLEAFSSFVEANRLTMAVRANLSLIETLHNAAFGFVPPPVQALLDRWDRQTSETKKMTMEGLCVPYYFTVRLFWSTFFAKLPDTTSQLSLINQAYHMLNPKFFKDVLRMVYRRTFGHEKYKHDW